MKGRAPKRRKTQSPSRTLQDQENTEQQPKDPETWIELATETDPYCAIPVLLPRFQADLPDLTDNRKDLDSEKFLGKKIWPLQDNNNKEVIGKGRPKNCPCRSPGSVECVNHHITEERNKLKTELGTAFSEWGFDTMGEDVSKGWSTREEKRFETGVKSIMPSKDKKSKESVRGRDNKSLVSYYFNVYTPRRIGKQTRSGCTEIDTDDDVPRKHEASSSSSKKVTKSGTNSGEVSSSRKPRLDKSKDNSGKDKYMSGYR